MDDDDLNKTEMPEASRGDVKDQFSREEERKLAGAMPQAHDRDALAGQKRRRWESDR